MNGEISIQTFVNDSLGKIRTAEIDGIIYFVAVDIATILGYTNSRDAVRKHVDEEDKLTVAICDGSSPNPNKTVINESGLYSLILQSKLPRARDFKRWVTSEVLPAIRQAGMYSLVGTKELKEQEYGSADSPQIMASPKDYLVLAKVIASCKTERLPLVLRILEKGGWDVGKPQDLVQNGAMDTADAGIRLREAAYRLNMSHSQLAKKLNWSKQTICSYINGSRFPKPRTYLKLLNDLDLLLRANSIDIDSNDSDCEEDETADE